MYKRGCATRTYEYSLQGSDHGADNGRTRRHVAAHMSPSYNRAGWLTHQSAIIIRAPPYYADAALRAVGP